MFSLFRKKNVEDWFGNDNLNVFCHKSSSYFSFGIKYKYRRTTITPETKNIEYFTQDK